MGTSAGWARPTASQIVARLRERPPFDRMEPDDLAWLVERLEVRRWPDGAVLLQPGREAQAFYVVYDGQAQMEAMGEVSEERRILAELGPGDCFPVEALEERRPVFSTIRARSALTCLQLSLADFRSLRRRSDRFREFSTHRASAFLEESRRIFHAHFSQRGGEPPPLSAPLSVLMRTRPVTCTGETPLREALRRVDEEGADVIVVVGEGERPRGLLDLPAILRRVTLPALDLSAPIVRVMLADFVQLPPGAFGFEAALEMASTGARQVLVVEAGRLAGIVHERDLFGLQRIGLGQTSVQIRHAADLERIASLAADVRTLTHNLLVQGVAAEQLIRIITALNDQICRRVVELEVARAGLDGVEFAWIGLGSEGRLEQTHATDQDNGIIFATPGGTDPEPIRAALLPFARRVNEALAACGFPLCKGEVMASNPRWCLSLGEWKETFAAWLARPDPEALLNATIFFDLRHLAGVERLTQTLVDWLADAAPQHGRFEALLGQMALGREPPLGVLREFAVTESGGPSRTIDLKLDGITLFVDAARVLALSSGIPSCGTVPRLRAWAERAGVPSDDVKGWIDAFHFVQLLRLRHQHELLAEGRPADNRIDPYALNPLDRRILHESLRQAGQLQGRLRAHFEVRGMRL